MAEEHIRGRGTPRNYKVGSGNNLPTESGPFIGIVKNNIDPTRAARLQVYIKQFAGPDENDESNWRTINYLPPFFGSTENSGLQGTGNFVGNKHSYGMWFTPPDIGTKVLCFFVTGDPNNGYYVGCIPEDSLNHMVPAIGSAPKYKVGTDGIVLGDSTKQLPVTEINNADSEINDSPEFFKKPKPVHSVVAGSLFGQGLIGDTIRGPITSSAQRESPSNVFGLSTPGKPIYSGVKGSDQSQIRTKLQNGELKPEQVKVIGREGGHSIVLDDGTIEGKDQLVRIRSAKGHQIIMSDDGNCFHIIHASGQSWLEFGQEGTVDVFSTNSVNVRTQGTINLHADKDINMYAGGKLNAYSESSMNLEAKTSFVGTGLASSRLYSKQFAGLKSDNTAALEGGKISSVKGGDRMDFNAGTINLNNGGGVPVSAPPLMKKNKVADAELTAVGWQAEFGKLETIATRVPTHEPWPYHNLGVENSVQFGTTEEGKLTPELATRVESKPPDNTITESDFAKEPTPSNSVGSLDEDQVKGLSAQKAKDVGQESTEISVDKGVGKYGLTANQLEETGHLKPGTVSKYLKDPSSTVTDGFGNETTQLESVLNNTNVWTGKSGANDLNNFLTDVSIQAQAQEDLYNTNLSDLIAKGVVKGTEVAKDLGGLIQAATVHGSDNVLAWSKGGGNALINSGIEQTARNGQYSINLVDTKLTDLVKSYSNPGAFAGTTDRTTLDDDITKILGDTRIRQPKFTRT